jgi:hypothetical protein
MHKKKKNAFHIVRDQVKNNKNIQFIDYVIVLKLNLFSVKTIL